MCQQLLRFRLPKIHAPKCVCGGGFARNPLRELTVLHQVPCDEERGRGKMEKEVMGLPS